VNFIDSNRSKLHSRRN